MSASALFMLLASAQPLIGAKITANSGTFGNMTANGGLTALFDGVTNQAGTACAALASGTAGYGGKNFGSVLPVFAAKIYSPNDRGFHGLVNTGLDTTISIYGKSSSPASATDGTLIASQTVPAASDTSGKVYTLTFSRAVLYQFMWGTLSFSSATDAYAAEFEFYSPA